MSDQAVSVAESGEVTNGNVTMHSEQVPVATKPSATPAHWMSVIDKMLDKNVSTELLSKVFEMQTAWEKEQQRQSFVRAFAAFKAEVPAAIDRTGEVGYQPKKPGSQKVGYRHVELDVACAALVPLMSKNGLAHSWETQQGDNGIITVTCRVEHEDGHCKTVTLRGAPDSSGAKNAIQSVGSAVYYLQRYTFMAALGMAQGGGDDDAEATDSEFITGDQIAVINTLLDTATVDLKGILTWQAVESLDKLPVKSFDKVAAELKRKQKPASPPPVPKAVTDALGIYKSVLDTDPSIDQLNKEVLKDIKAIKDQAVRVAVWEYVQKRVGGAGLVFDEKSKKFVVAGANP